MVNVLDYIDGLLKNSTLDCPAWNIEKMRSGEKSHWNYIDGCMIKAILEVYSIKKDEKYFRFADSFIDYRVEENGQIEGYNPESFNIDNVNAGKTLFELYDLTRKEKYKLAIENIYSQVVRQPRTREGNFWHKLIYPGQVWLDGLYMCQPFYMEYETRFNDRKNYDDIFKQFRNVREIMKDEATGLYYHAYDSSKQMFWCDKETGLSQNFWLRALGWYAMALLDTLDKCNPDGYEKEYEELKENYIEFMTAVCKVQDESGMFWQLPAFPGKEKNYLETSGSSIMAYSLLKGVRLGFLPESFREKGVKAFNGICDRFLVAEGEQIHLDNICLVAGLGGKQMRDGSYDYYMSEPIVKDDAKGVGPFLLAYTEMLRLA